MKKLLLGTLLAGAAALAQAQAITPVYTTFGTLAGATFGGIGIPNTAVAITTIPNATNDVILGLTAHTRFDALPVTTNNSAGAFFTQSGVDGNAPSPADPYAEWNVGFYIAGNLNPYNIFFVYDFDPAAGNAQSTHGMGFCFTCSGSADLEQGSYNMGMNFLSAPVPGVLTPPSPVSTFNPSANGTYTFALIAYSKTTNLEVGRSAISVTAVPEPGTYTMMLAGLAAVAALVRRRAR